MRYSVEWGDMSKSQDALDLTARFPARWPSRVITVLGAPGSGKTALLQSWAAAWRGRVIRLSGAPDIQGMDIARVVYGQLNPEGEPRNPRTPHTLLEALASRPTLLLFDNAEFVTEPALLAQGVAFLRDQPASTVVAIAGRRIPQLRWSKLRLTGRLAEFGPQDLHRAIDNLDPSSRDSVRRDLAFGWAEGRRLLAQTPGPVDADTLAAPLRDALADVSPDGRAILEAGALLGSASTNLLAAATGLPHAWTIVDQFQQAPLPMIEVSSEGGRRLHIGGAMRTLLLNDLMTREPSVLDAIVTGAAARLVEEDSDDAAFELIRQHGDRHRLAHFVFERSAHLALVGRPELTARWLTYFPMSEQSTDVGLQMAAALAQATAGDFRDFDAWLARVTQTPRDPDFPWNTAQPSPHLDAAGASGDDLPSDPGQAAWMVLTQVAVAAEALSSGRLSLAEGILNNLTAFSGDYPYVDAYRCALQAQLYFLTGRAAKGSGLIREADDLVERMGLSEHPRMLSLDAAALPYLIARGSAGPVEARILRLERKMARVVGGMTRARVHASLTLASSYLWLGRPRQAAEALREIEPVIGTLPNFRLLQEEYVNLVSRMPGDDTQAEPGLTTAELRVLRALTTHESVPRIAETMQVGVATIRSHIRSRHRKLHTHDRVDTVNVARSMGLLP